MRVLKATGFALALSLALGAGAASAKEWPKHHWVHGDGWFAKVATAFFHDLTGK